MFKPTGLLSIFLALFILAPLSKSALAEDCSNGEQESAPQFSSIDKGPGDNQIVLHWNFVAGGVDCVWPVSFWQVRWVDGEGTATQSQSQQMPVGDSGKGVYTLNLDTNKTWGFIIEACKTRFAASSICTPWSDMRHYKPYGPYQCKSPYVWRDAFPNDYVCVTTQTRQEAADDNAAAASRLAPDRVSCITGFTHRGANINDGVCVTPSTVQQVRDDNYQAIARRLF